MKRKGFTLIELLVVIAIIAMLLAILMPALSKVKKIAQRVVCGTNLKGLGTAQTVYANDYDDRYTVQKWNGATPGTIARETAGWQNVNKDWNAGGNMTVGASLYLLVREADVSPKSFVCPSSAEVVFDGQNDNNLDITELWDFGHPNWGSGPVLCQSYSYHNPYCSRAADGSRGASFAVMADKNPWHDAKLVPGATTPITAANYLDGVGPLFPDWESATAPQKFETLRANAQPHGREGQNVMFGDGHNAFEKRPDVGIKNDNIYTIRGGSGTPASQVRQGLVPVVQTYPAPAPTVSDDSFLINDSRN